jgi:transcriptional regulator with XRE-family HTH domain
MIFGIFSDSDSRRLAMGEKKNVQFVRLGEMVRERRKIMKVTLERLGNRVGEKGMSKGYLSGVENGKVAPPSSRVARRLAVVLGFPPDKFASLCELLKLTAATRGIPEIEKAIEDLYGGMRDGKPVNAPVTTATA